jgi:protein SCO1
MLRIHGPFVCCLCGRGFDGCNAPSLSEGEGTTDGSEIVTMPLFSLSRRGAITVGTIAFCAAAVPAWAWNSTEISGALPALQFRLTRASDGKEVGAADFKGKVVLLYFGYTYCPDVCPATLLNITDLLKSLGKQADDVRVLFVTVDPNRDTLRLLAQYTAAFAPQVVGLRGTPDELATLAKRYRVSYSVEPKSGGHDYEVTHSSAVYVFDRQGAARLVFTGLSQPNAPTAPALADLRELVSNGAHTSWWRSLLRLL